MQSLLCNATNEKEGSHNFWFKSQMQHRRSWLPSLENDLASRLSCVYHAVHAKSLAWHPQGEGTLLAICHCHIADF